MRPAKICVRLVHCNVSKSWPWIDVGMGVCRMQDEIRLGILDVRSFFHSRNEIHRQFLQIWSHKETAGRNNTCRERDTVVLFQPPGNRVDSSAGLWAFLCSPCQHLGLPAVFPEIQFNGRYGCTFLRDNASTFNVGDSAEPLCKIVGKLRRADGENDVAAGTKSLDF